MLKSVLNAATSTFVIAYTFGVVNSAAAAILGRYTSRIDSFNPAVDCTEADRLFIADFTTYMREADVSFASDLYLLMKDLADNKIACNATYNRAIVIFLALREIRKVDFKQAYRDRQFMESISGQVATLRLAAASIQIDESLDDGDLERALRGVVDMFFNIPFEALPREGKDAAHSAARFVVKAGNEAYREVARFINRAFA